MVGRRFGSLFDPVSLLAKRIWQSSSSRCFDSIHFPWKIVFLSFVSGSFNTKPPARIIPLFKGLLDFFQSYENHPWLGYLSERVTFCLPFPSPALIIVKEVCHTAELYCGIAYPWIFVSHTLLMYLNLSWKTMVLMVDLRKSYFDFIHGFLVKQFFFIISLIVLAVNDLVRELVIFNIVNYKSWRKYRVEIKILPYLTLASKRHY